MVRSVRIEPALSVQPATRRRVVQAETLADDIHQIADPFPPVVVPDFPRIEPDDAGAAAALTPVPLSVADAQPLAAALELARREQPASERRTIRDIRQDGTAPGHDSPQPAARSGCTSYPPCPPLSRGA